MIYILYSSPRAALMSCHKLGGPTTEILSLTVLQKPSDVDIYSGGHHSIYYTSQSPFGPLFKCYVLRKTFSGHIPALSILFPLIFLSSTYSQIYHMWFPDALIFIVCSPVRL